MKKLCSLSLVLALLMFCGVPSARALDEDDNIPARMSLAIVVDGEKENGMVGFIVSITPDNTYVLADTIMLQNGDPYLCFKMLFDVQSDGSRRLITENLIPAEPVWIDSSSNIVLLAVRTTEDVTVGHLQFPALAPMSAVSNGDTLYRMGLDITENNPSWSAFGLLSASTKGMAIVSSNYPSGLFSMTTVPNGGNEILDMGGPVIDDRGVVVGISAYVNLDGEVTDEFIFALDELIDHLDQENISYASPGYYGQVTDGVPSIVRAGSGGSTGTSNSPGSGGSSPPSSPRGTGSGSRSSSGGSGSGSSGGLFEDAFSGGLIGIAAAAGAGGILWRKKKRETPGPQAEQSVGSPIGGLTLLGIGGQMDGCRFPLQGGNLAFGRDPDRCAIVYDRGAPGISSLHCQLILQGGSWCLIDLASSYGTYLNGRRLEPSVPNPLRPGDTFWLGQPQNSFTLKEG